MQRTLMFLNQVVRVLIVTFWVSFGSTQAFGAALQIGAPVLRGEKLVAFETNEPGVYYLVPTGWQLDEKKSHLANAENESWRLRMTFVPFYSSSAEFVFETRSRDPFAVFLPLPLQLQKRELFLEGLAAETDFEVAPGATAPGHFLYFSLPLSSEQLSLLKTLNNGGVGLGGVVEYRWGDAGTGGESSSALLAQLDLYAATREPPADYGLDWLRELLTQNEFTLKNVLDTSLSLGLILVYLKNSSVELKLRPEQVRLARNGTRFLLTTNTTNADATVSVDIEPLGVHILVTAEAEIECELELGSLQFRVTKLKLQNVRGPVGELSVLATQVINERLLNEASLQKISRYLESELALRILNMTLFAP